MQAPPPTSESFGFWLIIGTLLVVLAMITAPRGEANPTRPVAPGFVSGIRK